MVCLSKIKLNYRRGISISECRDKKKSICANGCWKMRKQECLQGNDVMLMKMMCRVHRGRDVCCVHR